METFERSEPVTVAVRAGRGEVTITATDIPVVQVDVSPMDASAAAAQAARDTHVALEGHTLVVDTPTRSGWQWRRTPNLGITIHVPTGSSIVATVASAAVRADGRFAEARVKSASGEIWIDELTGAATIESASGDVTAGRVGGALRIGSASGHVSVRAAIGDVAAKAASGNITIRLAGGSVSAETASGDVMIGSVRRGQAAIRTESGGVEVGVPAGTGVWLDVSTASGSTVNELSMGGEPAGGAARPPLRLRIRTASGDIAIRRVQDDLRAAA